MKSKAHLKGHPIHPMLIVFPIAFFNGTLLFDILGWAFDNPGYHTTALHLEVAGLAFALLAATPGVIDFIYTVPPHSTGKKRAAKHGLTNLLVVVLFALALSIRLQDNYSLMLILALETVGAVFLAIAGWMGGTLVTRNQISIDPRYANAGKWKEQQIWVHDGVAEVATTTELKTSQMKLIHLAGKRIVVARTETGYVAFDDHCPHRGGSLAGGALVCGTVQCPWHGSQFDVKTGEVKAGPAEEKIKTYSLRESNGRLYINPEIVTRENVVQ